FARAALYLDAHGARRALTTSEDMVFYLRGLGVECRAPALPTSLSALSAAEHGGYYFAVLENHHNSPVSAYIRAHAARRLHVPALGGGYHGENVIASENSNPPGSKPVGTEWVNVYDL